MFLMEAELVQTVQVPLRSATLVILYYMLGAVMAHISEISGWAAV